MTDHPATQSGRPEEHQSRALMIRCKAGSGRRILLSRQVALMAALSPDHIVHLYRHRPAADICQHRAPCPASSASRTCSALNERI